MKDRQGKKMSDAYLISKLAPNILGSSMSMSGLLVYIHFSGAHLLFRSLNYERISEVEYVIGWTETNYPESSWLESSDAS